MKIRPLLRALLILVLAAPCLLAQDSPQPQPPPQPEKKMGFFQRLFSFGRHPKPQPAATPAATPATTPAPKKKRIRPTQPAAEATEPGTAAPSTKPKAAPTVETTAPPAAMEPAATEPSQPGPPATEPGAQPTPPSAPTTEPAQPVPPIAEPAAQPGPAPAPAPAKTKSSKGRTPKGTAKTTSPKAAADDASLPTDPDARNQALFERAKAQAMEDKSLQDLRTKMEDAVGTDDQARASKAFYKALYAHIRKAEPSLKDYLDRREAALMRRLGQ